MTGTGGWGVRFQAGVGVGRRKPGPSEHRAAVVKGADLCSDRQLEGKQSQGKAGFQVR